MFRGRYWPPSAAHALDHAHRTLRWLGDDDVESRFGVYIEYMETELDFDIFKEQSWRKILWGGCEGSGASDDCMSDEADEELEALKEEMIENDLWGFRYDGRDGLAALRMLITWLMEHRLDIIINLLDEGMLHVGNALFPACFQPWHDAFSSGEAESLLSIAARDVCNPNAVRMLLGRGADPNCELVHLSFNGQYDPTCGPGGLACHDVRGYWRGSKENKLEVLTALAEAGGEMCDAYDWYDRKSDKFTAELQLCARLWSEEMARVQQKARVRFENVVALNGIVSFWRRLAALPGSKAAVAAH